MSTDFKDKKDAPHGQYPANVQSADGQGAAGFSRVDKWLDVERLKDEFLFGIPLVSLLTKQKLSDASLKNIIIRAAAQVELDCNVDVFPVVRVVRLPFDRTKNQQGFGQMNVGIRPIKSLLEISIRTSATELTVNNTVMYDNPTKEGNILYKFPLEWIDTSLMRKGILAFTPLQSSPNSLMPGGSFGGAAAPLLIALQQLNNFPGFWYVRFESGFDENSIPSTVNELIGTYAAMIVLSMLGPTRHITSQSMSIDGVSQSTSGPGYQLFVVRYQQLQERAAQLKDLIKKRFTTSIFMDNI